jgi:hypothetical protein
MDFKNEKNIYYSNQLNLFRAGLKSCVSCLCKNVYHSEGDNFLVNLKNLKSGRRNILELVFKLYDKLKVVLLWVGGRGAKVLSRTDHHIQHICPSSIQYLFVTNVPCCMTFGNMISGSSIKDKS